MLRQKTSQTVYCFSPPVMIATFIIELMLAAWALLKHRQSRMRNLVAGLLLLLALFQLAEYFVCGGWQMSALTWSRIGYVAITLLPALGVHIVASAAGRRTPMLAYAVDVVALTLVAFFVFAPTAINQSVCAGNYVIFHLHGLSDFWYGAYYYGAILVSIMLAGGYIEASDKPRVRSALRWYIIGTMAFLIPTATVNILDPRTVAGIPSIMCGFAVLFALVVSLRVLPLTASRRP